jgi:predicted nucleic acid-binding protein
LAEVGTSALSRFISSPGVQASVEIDEVAVQLDALDRFRRTKAHFVDCLLAATVVAEDLPVASFDHDFRKFGDVRVEAE